MKKQSDFNWKGSIWGLVGLGIGKVFIDYTGGIKNLSSNMQVIVLFFLAMMFLLVMLYDKKLKQNQYVRKCFIIMAILFVVTCVIMISLTLIEFNNAQLYKVLNRPLKIMMFISFMSMVVPVIFAVMGKSKHN